MRKITLFSLMLIHLSVIAQIKVGTKAPELTLEGIYNRENSKIPTIESLKGKIVILDFWATWCTPCVAAFPENNKLSTKYKDKNVQFIAITDDPKEKLENFLGKMKIDFWVGRDDDKKDFKNYNVNGRPQMYIINKEGTIVYQGNKITPEMIEEVIATNTINPQKKENISYPSSAAAVVFGVHLSAQGCFRLDRKSPAIRPCV
jgi:peroxiredoxin